MLKRTLCSALALSLLSAPLALADRGGRHGGHFDKHAYRQVVKFKHYGHRWSRPAPVVRYRYDRRVEDWIAPALVGSAITYALLHSHDGVRCDTRHDRHSRYWQRDSRFACYRVDYLPGGRERRIELPAHACR